MGARVRLKSTVNVSAYPAEVRVILTALQRYGMFLADNGSNWYMSGAPDARWNNDTLRRFSEIKGEHAGVRGRVQPDGPSGLGAGADGGPATATAATTAPSCSPRPAARVAVARTVPGGWT